MKDILKNIGLLSVVVGVVILSLAVFKDTTTNSVLIISLIFVVVGFLGHIILNKVIK
jgi:hypothetical protein